MNTKQKAFSMIEQFTNYEDRQARLKGDKKKRTLIQLIKILDYM